MIDRFLNAKHWQLFILMVGIPMTFQIIMMGMLFSEMLLVPNTSSGEIPNVFNMMSLFPIVMLLFMGVFFGWFWSISIGLQSQVPEYISMKTNKFKVFFFIPLLYILVLSLVINSFFSDLGAVYTVPSEGVIGGAIGVIVPLHLLSMFGIFYSMYFTAKTIKTVELQREVSFGDFAGEFFLIWFYFIGVWIIQPKINKMAEERDADIYGDYR